MSSLIRPSSSLLYTGIIFLFKLLGLLFFCRPKEKEHTTISMNRGTHEVKSAAKVGDLLGVDMVGFIEILALLLGLTVTWTMGWYKHGKTK